MGSIVYFISCYEQRRTAIRRAKEIQLVSYPLASVPEFVMCNIVIAHVEIVQSIRSPAYSTRMMRCRSIQVLEAHTWLPSIAGFEFVPDRFVWGDAKYIYAWTAPGGCCYVGMVRSCGRDL